MKKKIAAALTSACLICGIAFGFTACKDKDPGEHEHVWNDGKITTEATCFAEGEKTYECTVKGCKETKTEAVSKLEHSWNGGTVTENPTCKDAGVKTYACQTEGCDATRNEPIDKIAHVWDSGVITSVPDISLKGEITYSCGVCGATDKQAVAPRADFSEQFYTVITEENNWRYGSAQSFDTQTGEFTFTRISQTDGEEPAVWKAEGVAISADAVSSANNAAIAYLTGGVSESDMNIKVAFTGEEETTRLSAYLVIKDENGEVRGEARLISDGAKDWTFSPEKPVRVEVKDALYIVFVNVGEGKPAGKVGITVSAACVHEWDEGESTKTASCSEFGETTYACNKCGETKIEYTAKLNHDFSGEWMEVDTGDARKCANCTETDPNVLPHDMQDVEPIDAQTMKTQCSRCGKEGTREIYSGCAEGTAFANGNGKHWNTCATHGTACGTKYNEENHDFNTERTDLYEAPLCNRDEKKVFECECGETEDRITTTTVPHGYGGYIKDADNVTHHHQVCGNCGNVSESLVHSWDAGSVTTQPQLTADGVKTFNCTDCGHTKTEPVAANADFTREFSKDDNPNGAWQYGYSDYSFGPEAFDFHAATDKTDDNVGWKINSSQIKDGWIDSGSHTTIAYTVSAAMQLDADVVFNGGEVNSRVAMRIAVKDSGGNMKYVKFYNEGQSARNWNVNTAETDGDTLNLDAGDTVYFIFFNEGDANLDKPYPNGELRITLTKKA